METNILVIGREPAILEVIERLIDAHANWHATITGTLEAAVQAIDERKNSIAFVSAGISAAEEEIIREKLISLDPEIVVSRHFGGGSGLLENEILGILNFYQQ
jgi:hypothetical protein